jgi:hypothetical protein
MANGQRLKAKKKIVKVCLDNLFLSPLDCCGTSYGIISIVNLEEREIIALLVANGKHLAQATLLCKVDIEAKRTIFGQIFNW